MNIFVVSDAFERPVSTVDIPASFKTLRAEECAECHPEFYTEWSTSMHSMAWTDPYFQVDWRFDRSQQICKNCHTPLDRQQEDLVIGFRDRSKWNLILAPYSSFKVCKNAYNLMIGEAWQQKKTDRRDFLVPPLQAGLENPAYRR